MCNWLKKKKLQKNKGQEKKKDYLRNTTPEIGEKCISDGEDEIVLLCRIPVLLVPIKKKKENVLYLEPSPNREIISLLQVLLRKCWRPRSLY